MGTAIVSVDDVIGKYVEATGIGAAEGNVQPTPPAYLLELHNRLAVLTK